MEFVLLLRRGGLGNVDVAHNNLTVRAVQQMHDTFFAGGTYEQSECRLGYHQHQ